MTASVWPLPPGGRGMPVLGHSWPIAVDPPRFVTRQYQKYGPVSRFRAVGKQWVLATGTEACAAVLGDQTGAYVAASAWEAIAGPSLRTPYDDSQYLKDLRVLAHAVTGERLDDYLKQINAVMAHDLPSWLPGNRFRAQDAMRTVTLRILVRVFMGGGLGSEAPTVEKALVANAAATRMIVRLPVPGSAWSRAMAGRALLENLFRERIPIMRVRGGSDFFAVLCRAAAEDDDNLSDEDVVNHMIFLLVAAYNPLTFVLVTMMRFLGEHEEWQERCRQESLALATDEPDRADLDKLVSLDLVMRECLRLVPPLPLLPRSAVRDVDLLGYRIPRGTPLMVSTYITQRSAEFWSDPDRFDPDRFAEDRREDLTHEYAWLPFGDGMHQCIGRHFTAVQVKAAMHHVIRSYRWRLAEGYEPAVNWRGLPSMRGGLPVRLERAR